MTNKINGIDVSECEKLGETIDGFTCGLGKRIRFANEIITKHNLCKDNPDCYFKQFKRLQKENEGLKSLNDFNVQKIEVLQEENEELYKALEEIRNEIGDLKNINRLINLQKILDIINEAFGNE